MDPTVTHQLAVGPEKSHDAEPAADDQMVVGHIPAHRSGFQPRPALLGQLDQVGRAAQVLVLTGPPGVGKTQLAAAHARARSVGGRRLIAWIDAQDRESLLAGLAAVADAIRLPDGGSDRGVVDAGQAVRRWLEEDGHRCLLVFDGADDPDVLRPFMPAGGAAQVLITATAEPVAELGIRIPVHAFSGEEALALLDGRTGLTDEAGAAAVAAALGHLPLALDHAAAAIAGQDLGYAAYLAQLRALPIEKYQVREEEQQYPQGVVEAVLLSEVILPAADRTGVCTGLMEIMAVLSQAAVRRDLLRAAGPAGLLASGGQRVDAPVVDEALAHLEERSLLGFSLDGQAVIAHRLVARVVREGLARRGRLSAACRVAASALRAFAEALEKSPDRAAVRDLLGGVRALLHNARDLTDDTDEKLTMTLARLRFLTLHHLIELGDNMPQAIAIGEPLTADLERLLGPDHPDTLNARNSLAVAFRAAGRTAEAVPLFEQTLAGRERLLGPDHPDTITSQDNLADAYREAGRFAEAILLYRMALAAREWLLGPDHPDTITSQNNLAAAYRDAGRFADALPLVEQVLAARERVLGTDHPSTLASRHNLAAVYRDTGRAVEAVPLYEQTLAACERLLGPDHPRTRATRHHLTRAREEASLAREEASLAGEPGYGAEPVGDGEADAEGDEDLVGERDGEGDLDGLGERDLTRLREGDGDGPADADDESTGGGKTTWG